MFLRYPNSQDEIWVQRKCIHKSVVTKVCFLGNQSGVFNLNTKSKKNFNNKLLYNQRHVNYAMFRKNPECIFTGYILFTLVHL